MISLRWQFYSRQPEMLDRVHYLEKLFQADRLGNITIRIKVIGIRHVCVRLGGREDDDWNAAEALIAFDFREDLPSIFAGKVQVEQDEIRALNFGEAAFAPKE